MLLLWGLREFPRLTVLFTFFVYHQEVFVPLLRHTSETEIEEVYMGNVCTAGEGQAPARQATLGAGIRT